MSASTRTLLILVVAAVVSTPALAQDDTAADSTAFTMTAEELAEYAGDYELAPGFVLTIYTEDDQIFGQATGQGSAEIFPSEKDEFFYTVVDAQLSFNRNDDGEIISLTLHQGGQVIPGKKIN